MATSPRFLIGFGERLTEPVDAPPGGPVGPPPYTVEQARTRIGAMAQSAAAAAERLNDRSCPNDLTVAAVTLHPSYLSKSGFPQALLDTADFRHLGSRPSTVIPEQLARRIRDSDQIEYFHRPDPRPTTELFVATTREHLRAWSAHLASDEPLQRNEDQVVRLEQFALNTPAERDRLIPGTTAAEVVLHAADPEVIVGLYAFCEPLDIQLLMSRRLDAGSLVFIPARGDYGALQQLADFSFTRVVRAVPSMRRLLTAPPEPVRSIGSGTVELPAEGPTNPELRVAVFDGGLPTNTVLSPWVTTYPIENGQ